MIGHDLIGKCTSGTKISRNINPFYAVQCNNIFFLLYQCVKTKERMYISVNLYLINEIKYIYIYAYETYKRINSTDQ